MPEELTEETLSLWLREATGANHLDPLAEDRITRLIAEVRRWREREAARPAAVDALSEALAAVDTDRNQLRAALEGCCHQFATAIDTEDPDAGRTVPELWTGGVSALEEAFRVLGWDDPHRLETAELPDDA